MITLFKNKKKLSNCFKSNKNNKMTYLTKAEKIANENKIEEIKYQVNNYFNNRCL